jgi:hypothetical protein
MGTGHRQNVESTRAAVASPVSAAETISGFRVTLAANAPTGGIDVTFFVGATATSLTCTIAAGNDTCTSGAASTSVTATDRVAVEVTKATAAGAVRGLSWTAALS